MITHKNIVDFLKTNLTTYFNTVNDGKYSDFADNMDVFEESSYNSNKDIVVTVQFLKGSTQLGFTDLPINVIFEVIESKATEDVTVATQVMDLINSFIEDFNDTTTLMYDEENLLYNDSTDQFTEEANEQPYVVHQYYSSTNAIGNGQQRGDNKYKAFSMDMRLIIYKNGYYQALTGQTITFNLAVGNTPTLVNLLQVTSHISKPQQSYTAGASYNQKMRTTVISYQIQVSYIATKTNLLHVKLANEALTNETYNITHAGFVTRTANMKVIDYVEDTPYADVMKVTMTLAKEG